MTQYEMKLILARLLLFFNKIKPDEAELDGIQSFVAATKDLPYNSNFIGLTQHFEHTPFLQEQLTNYLNYQQTPHSINSLFHVLGLLTTSAVNINQKVVALQLSTKEEVRQFVIEQADYISIIKNFYNPTWIEIQSIDLPHQLVVALTLKHCQERLKGYLQIQLQRIQSYIQQNYSQQQMQNSFDKQFQQSDIRV